MPFLAIVLVCILSSLPATAADRSAEELAVARELFEQAQSAQQAEDWSTCERLVAEAVAIIETPGLRFHLAFCKEHQGRWVGALVDYKRALELVRGGVEAADVAELLGPAIERMERTTPRLTLTLSDVPKGTTLYLDGKERSPRLLGKSIPVDPGGVRLNVSAPGYEPFERHINMLSEERRTISIVLIEKDARALVAAEPPAQNSVDVSHSGAKAWVLVGEAALTLGGLALGVVNTVDGADLTTQRDGLAKDIGNSACAGPSPDPRCPGLAALGDNQARAEALELTGYLVAGAGLTSFVATWLLWDTAPARNSATHSLELSPTASGALAVWSGLF